MAVALHSWIIEKDGSLKVRHSFYAETEEEAERMLKQHAAGCGHFGPANAEERTIEIIEEIDELPTEDTLEEFEGGWDDDGEEDDEEEK